jgi:hypothetical protein
MMEKPCSGIAMHSPSPPDLVGGPLLARLAERHPCQVNLPGSPFGRYRQAAHQLASLTIRQNQPGLRYDDDIVEVRWRIGDWHDLIPALLAATAGPVLCHDFFDLDPPKSYVDVRGGLLGDVAHATPPSSPRGRAPAPGGPDRPGG